MKARTARITRTGGPEVIEWVDHDLSAPGPGEATVRHTAVGLNFIDTYHRSGLYRLDLPSGLGGEAVGVVEAVGEGVAAVRPGDRVGSFGPSRGAYATARNVPAAELLPIPDDIDDEVAATLLLKGGTTEYLVERCAKVRAGQTALVYAVAGGVGHLLAAWLKALDVTVIGTAGSAAKAAQARAAGVAHVIEHKREKVVERVRAITGGRGVDVVFDGVGMAMWDTSLKSVARRGLIASFGNTGGAVEGVALGALAAHGSLFVTRPTMFDYYVTPEERAAGMARVWDMLRAGAISPDIGQRFPLDRAADAHRALEAGATRGATVLTLGGGQPG